MSALHRPTIVLAGAIGLLLWLGALPMGAALANDGCPPPELAALKAERKLQEAVWCLRRAGNAREANRLRDQLAAILTSGAIAEVKAFGGSGTTTSELFKVRLADGISGIFKPEGKTLVGRADQAPNKEIAVSRLDEVLELSLVPLTVARTVAGRAGSLQYWVEGVKSGGSRGDAVSVSRTIKFFDALLANFDRHAGNYLIDARGRQIAIDHNLAFDEYKYKRPADLRALIPTRRAYESLKRASDARIREALKGLIVVHQIDSVLRRKQELIEILDRLTESGTRSELFER